ncbi:MAG: PHP domain-containing protein, partial [bacterium]|nr:PHP domain-containing protein [bacterium]
MGLCDFHTHSTASDGKLTPAELVEEAVRCRLSCFALTDHDTLAGVMEAEARSQELGLFFVPG